LAPRGWIDKKTLFSPPPTAPFHGSKIIGENGGFHEVHGVPQYVTHGLHVKRHGMLRVEKDQQLFEEDEDIFVMDEGPVGEIIFDPSCNEAYMTEVIRAIDTIHHMCSHPGP
jgi:hypothetical protein